MVRRGLRAGINTGLAAPAAAVRYRMTQQP
jgi:hypothetical protein